MSSLPGPAIDALAFMLLRAFKRHDERSREPVFAQDLAAELGLGQGDAERAFRYLNEKGWLETFNLPYAGRINARGHDAILAREREQEGARLPAAAGRGGVMEWDVFISHASEDKADVAVPLAERLRAEGLRVWLDSFELTVGDSLRQSIEKGLAASRFGIAIISPTFLQKHWPQAELDGLAAREAAGVKVILPVWHRVDEAAISSQSPMLAGRLAATTDKGLDHVVTELLRAIRRDASPTVRAPAAAPPVAPAAPLADLRRLSQMATTFHTQQTERIAIGQGPITVLDAGMLVLHILPYAAVDSTPITAFDELARQAELFPPMKGHVQGVQIGYDGVLIGSNARGLREPQRAYVHINRTGTIEAVISSLATGQGTKWVELPHLQALVIRYVTDYIHALSRFGVVPPFAVLVSLANMTGVRLLRDFKESALAEDIPFGLLNQDRLPFGQCVLESVPVDDQQTARLLKPILTHLANAAGLAASPYFDADGKYTLDLRRA